MEVKGMFSKAISKNKDNPYKCYLYKAVPETVTPFGKQVIYFKAVGNLLPSARGITYVFHGKWRNDQKDSTFEVASFEEVIAKDRNGIVQYLKTLDGVGDLTAQRLFNHFGKDIFDILDGDIERIREVEGIKDRLFNRIRLSWIKKRAGMELYSYLLTFDVPNVVIARIFDRYEGYAITAIKSNPYLLMDIQGFGFSTADRIAKANGKDLYSTDRIAAGVIAAMKEYENGGRVLKEYNKRHNADHQHGNSCIRWPLLYDLSKFLLDVEISDKELGSIIVKELEDRDIIIVEEEYFYRRDTFRREMGIAKNVRKLLSWESQGKNILTEENVLRIEDEMIASGNLPGRLSDEQRKAVCVSMNNHISIITGGPGTGKTLVQKVIISAMKKMRQDVKIALAAPTGKAAHRMKTATGMNATTLHSLLRYHEEENVFSPKVIDADIIIVDEFSMIDTRLANVLLAAVSNGCRVVCVGDEHQLPSVSAGAVLREFIASEMIPTVLLTSVFRQSKGSSIGYNAQRIRLGETKMQEDEAFFFIEAGSSTEIKETVRSIYVPLVMQYGLEGVCVLSPYREKTVTGVNHLNRVLQNEMFPDENKENDCFFVGDKVMWLKNEGELTNGDVGIVTKCDTAGAKRKVSVCFENKSVVDFENDQLQSLELAYATTVHKSQGSEYPVVIFIIDPAHSIMHKRNLIYTAITRAKEKIILVGSKGAFARGVLKEDDGKRESCLSYFIRHATTNTNDYGKCEQLVMNLDVQ